MSMEAFDIVLLIFFLCFSIWFVYVLYNGYTYYCRTRKLVCLFCNVEDEIQGLHHCRNNSKHKFHLLCLQKAPIYQCPACVTEV